MRNIHDFVLKLSKQYDTHNPYEIAKAKNIIIFREELGTIKGYYNMPYRQKQIHVNCNLSEPETVFTCAHELGHALLHPKSNTTFLKSCTYLSVDKLEIEANRFAIELLLSDELLLEYKQYNTEQIARLTGYNEELILMRIFPQ